MSNGDQRSMIRDAMQAIAQRKPGKSKLFNDKNEAYDRAVSEGVPTPQALNITADDAICSALSPFRLGGCAKSGPN